MREEAQKGSEAELSDLLICLGQEQSKLWLLSKITMDCGDSSLRDAWGLLELHILYISTTIYALLFLFFLSSNGEYIFLCFIKKNK